MYALFQVKTTFNLIYQFLVKSFPHNIGSDSFLKRLLYTIWIHKISNAEEVWEMFCVI